jgi:hypothetical protein
MGYIVEKSASVILCEPQCCGFEHSPFNAALLDTLRLAYPSSEIVFFAEKEHISYVRRELALAEQGKQKITFRCIKVPARQLCGWRRMPNEFVWCSQILAKALHKKAKVLMLCSLTNTGLLVLKYLMCRRRFKLPTIAVLHGCLAGITGRQSRRPWNWIIGLGRVLSLPHPSNLRLVALGDSILNNVKKFQPKRESQWCALDHVYLWPSNGSETSPQPHQIGQPVRFGFVGVSGKGFDIFCQLAQDIAPLKETTQFMMAGFYNGSAEKKPACRYIPDIPDKPLSRKEFEDRVHKLSYVVWTAKPDHYRLTASGTFLDAMAFLKPGIYLRSDYIEYCFELMGDIGYLCNNYEDMVSTIREIILKFPSVRYRQQVENIRKERIIFEPQTLAPRLREIVESCT